MAVRFRLYSRLRSIESMYSKSTRREVGTIRRKYCDVLLAYINNQGCGQIRNGGGDVRKYN